MYKRFLKRAFDVVASLMAIAVLSVPMLVIALAIRIGGGGPVLFKQMRVGKGQKQFSILKFRTMRTDAPADMPSGDPRDPERWVTRLGTFLRRTSIDELPQIFNILAGQMSFVGPRPVIPNEEELIAERDLYGANDVRPGLTGWAQINGRETLTDTEKATLDGEYVRMLGSGFFRGILIDARCIIGTVPTVIKSARKGRKN